MKRYFESCKAEWLKVFTTRSWWVLGLVMVIYVAFTAAVVAGSVGAVMTVDGQELDAFGAAPMVYALAPTIGYIFPVLLGALSITVEYRHGTITPTFIWAGNRSRVLSAKVLVQFLMGMLYGIAGVCAAVAASVFFFMKAGIPTELGSPEIWLQFLRTVVDMGIWAVLGVGVGILVRNQAAAIVIVIVFTQFIEPLARLGAALNDQAAAILSYLPGAASDAFTGNSFYSMVSSAAGYDQLQWWAGGLVLLGYAALAVGVGWATRWRADVA